MRAQIQQISGISKRQQIHLISNQMAPIFNQTKFLTKRYKKVGDQVKERLLKFFQKGVSIIYISKKLGINYSTAKSIVQSHRKKKLRCEQDQSQVKGSSTDECYNLCQNS